MIGAELRRADREVGRLAERLGALRLLSERQAALPEDDGDAWAALQRRKQPLYDDLDAMGLPDLFLRLRRLADPAPGDGPDAAAARRALSRAAEAQIVTLQEIAASETSAQRRLAKGLGALKQRASALRRGSELQRAYGALPSPQPRFLDARE